MRHRSLRLSVTILLALSFVAVFASVSSAFAIPIRSQSVRPLRLAPLTGGADIGTAVDLPASPVTGSLNAADEADMDDVYKIYLNVGEVVTLALNGPAGSEFAVNFYRPGTASVLLDDFLDTSWGPDVGSYPQEARFVAGTEGWHYIDVAAYDGSGSYTMTWQKPAPPVTMARYAGTDRYQTAIKISQAAYGNGASSRVILATGANFADALAASALAGSYDCPILLTQRTGLATGLLTEIDRLRGASAGTVMIVGSGSAVDTSVADALRAHGLTVDRFAGPDRYATAVEIGKEVRRHEIDDLGHSWSGQAFVCLGTNFPDALAASPFAARMKMPVLLVKTASAPTVTQNAFAQLGITKAYVIGGTGTVTQPTMDHLSVASRERLFGSDRFDTAAKVAGYAIGHGWADGATVGIATGRKFPDALGGGPALGKVGGVLLLTDAEWMPDFTYFWVADHASTLENMRVFGSHATVSDTAFSEFLYARDFGLEL